MSQRWIKERKTDYHYKMAKKENYRSRASYKLLQIDDKFKIFKKRNSVIDLGCSPGGWSQVAKELTDGIVIGIDILDTEKLNGVEFIKGDITQEETINKVISLLNEIQKSNEKNFGVGVVISDMSPNISGSYSTDHARSIYLCEKALEFAEKVLKKNGNFVVKVFQGDLLQEFFDRVKSKFAFCKIFKPKSSRARSSEVYIIAKGFQKSLY